MVDFSTIDVVIDGDCVASITVEVSADYFRELGTADEFNAKLRKVVSELIQTLCNEKHVQ